MEPIEEIHRQHWGDGPPILALHGLGLESTAFTGLASYIIDHGFELIAADLPGFGLSPSPDGPLTPAALTEPVLEYAAQLDTKPLVMGFSLGARIALEAALVAPELFRGAVMVVPPLPWRHHRPLLHAARLISPSLAQRVPVERFWPQLKQVADRLESSRTGDDVHDWAARVGNRMIYYVSCPATRRAFFSAARELALDPAYGPDGLWTQLGELALPSAFVWADKDRFVGTANAPIVAETVPGSYEVHVPCAGHFKNGPHFRCMEAGIVDALLMVDERSRRRRWQAPARDRLHTTACLVDRGRECGSAEHGLDDVTTADRTVEH